MKWNYYRIKPASKWVTNCGRAWVVKRDREGQILIHANGSGRYLNAKPRDARQIVENILRGGQTA